MAPARKPKYTELKDEDKPLRQTIATRAFLDEQMVDAKEKYPDLEENKALEKYAHKYGIEGIFFRDNEGRRCLWGKEIHYLRHEGPRSYGAVEQWFGSRNYFIRHEKNMYQINMPKPAKKIKMIGIGANLAGIFLVLMTISSNFQRVRKASTLLRDFDVNIKCAEIQEIIIGMVVTVPSSKSITPILTSSNWARTWHLPGYRISDYRGVESSLALQNSNDRDGQYIRMYPVQRAAIDASCLRVCKNIYAIGIRQLYRQKMHFGMFENGNALARNLIWVYKGKGKSRKAELIEWVPDPSKPFPQDDDYTKEIFDAMNAITKGSKTMELPGFVYHDDFLRMLNGIRPRNAAFLRQISFAGTVKLHQCQSNSCGNKCDHDLVHSLRTYVPFMALFCTGLEKLHIRARDDRISDDDLQYALLNRLPISTEEALEPLLAYLRRIESLGELVVVDEDGSPLECAKPTQLWLKEKTAKRDRVARDIEDQALAYKTQCPDVCTLLKLNPAAPIFNPFASHRNKETPKKLQRLASERGLWRPWRNLNANRKARSWAGIVQ